MLKEQATAVNVNNEGQVFGEEDGISQAQTWLERYYPENGTCIRKNESYYNIDNYGKTREQITKLDISGQALSGSLKLTGFDKLEVLNCSENDLTSLDLSDCISLNNINCPYNQLTFLDVSNLTNLEIIYCRDNQLVNLNLTNCSSLKEIRCVENYLCNLDFLTNLPKGKLEVFDLNNNNFSPTDLSPFSKFIELKKLYLGNDKKGRIEQSIYNRFTGSLEPLKYLNKLEDLNIANTDIDSGPEYLPNSVQYFGCSTEYRPESQVKVIEQELAPYIDEEGKYDFSKWRDENVVKMVPTLPPSLSNEKGNKFPDNYEIKEKYYDDKIHLKNSLSQEPAELPFRLYSIKENKIEKTTEGQGGKYAILSYVWGKSRKDCEVPEEAEKELNSIWKNSSAKYENNVTLLGYKSWRKAIEACKHLGIDRLWMDQLCINQAEKTAEEQKEMEQEVSKMRQYYGSATVTLIAIQTKAKADEEELDLLDILKRITCSEWFTRSWTFQEGWLSKWTLFMFDDILVDGREMAALWVFQQPSHIDIRFSKSDADQGLKKVATPIGWVYYKGKDEKGYKSTDAVSLRLHEALREIKTRGRYLPIDGVYSILGLLPYGDKVKINYKKGEDGMCTREYTEEELKKALLSVMKVAIKYGHGEPLAWHGIGSGWLPQINNEGSTTIEGGIKIDYLPQKDEEILQPDGSLKVIGSEYKIIESGNVMSRWDQSSSIESGARERKVWIKDKDEKEQEIELSGTKAILSLMNKLVKDVKDKEKRNDIRLLVPNKHQWRSTRPFAILVEVEENNNHYGLGLVEISEGSEKLQGAKEEEIIIQSKPNTWLSQKNHNSKKEELQSQIRQWKSEWKEIQKQLPISEQQELLAQIQIEVSEKFT